MLILQPLVDTFGLAQVTDIPPQAPVDFPVPPSKPLACPICKQSHTYESDDVVEAGYLDPLQLIPATKKA
jgi:hypothetical protein